MAAHLRRPAKVEREMPDNYLFPAKLSPPGGAGHRASLPPGTRAGSFPSRENRSRFVGALAILIVAVLTWPGPAVGQVTAGLGDLGSQARADAASQLIVIAVQQAISALPPTSGQSATYSYDPKTDAYKVSRRLGPISLRTPATLPAGVFGLRVAASYFELSGEFGPIPYDVRVVDGQASFGKTDIGLAVDARVGLVNIAADYGLNDWIQLSVNLPIVLVDTDADEVVLTQGDGGFELVRRPLENEAAFGSGTNVGVGRIDLGARARILSLGAVQAAADLHFLFPSPSEAQFSGPDSPALLGRLIVGYEIAPAATLLADAGYDYDFDVAALRRAIWDVGISMDVLGATCDLGFGGSVYDQGVEWTPSTAFGEPTRAFRQGFVLEAMGDNRLGTNFVDFLGGLKLRLAPKLLLAGAIAVPLTKDGLRPDALGTLALEFYF